MKEKELHKEYERQQQIVYVEKDDGSYGPVQAGSYLTNNFLDDFWFKKTNLEKQLTIQVSEDKYSPVYYYMLLNELSEAELAARVGISPARVKKHLQMKYFFSVRVSALERYALVFGIPVANLFQVIQYEENNELKSFFIQDKASDLFEIEQVKTQNPCFVLTQIKRKTK